MIGFHFTRRQLLLSGIAIGVASSSTRAAIVEKPVRWLVGYPPGGATDALARLISPLLGSRISQTVIVDNRAGAGSAIAATALAGATPDGSTIMGADNGTIVINPIIYKDLKYDPNRDFRPIGLYAGINLVLATSAKSGIGTAAEYIDKARAAKDPMIYASPGVGSPLHLAMERLARDAKIKLTHVPYRGMAPALSDALGGVVPSIVVDYATASGAIKEGMLRPLAVFSASRMAALPDVPTIAEQGLPGFSAGAWQGLIAPRMTPDEIVAQFSDALGFALSDPAVKRRYDELGLDLPKSDTATFEKRWQDDEAIWQPLIRSLNIKIGG